MQALRQFLQALHQFSEAQGFSVEVKSLLALRLQKEEASSIQALGKHFRSKAESFQQSQEQQAAGQQAGKQSLSKAVQINPLGSQAISLTESRGGGTDTVGEDTGDMCMDVGVVTASEGRIVIGVMVMEAVGVDVVHAGVSGDATGRVVDEEEEGDTVEAVDVGVSASGWC
ncbi:hypothetical protein NDU88_002110 [Pleurodeles waltl]|uniref:Uncharacterized protein n=1 Tax=Pleurodeles waltl TaxID=8319 RepID=A0AAV7NGP9_PLEWA|nr:hypothetical protein NDU88_002110 [Pleurodeles waltl]